MTAQVHSQPHTEPPAMAHPTDHLAEYQREHSNAQHQQALRLALGSILSPKRGTTPSTGSRGSSGTASPAFPFAHAQIPTPPGGDLPSPPSHDHQHWHHGHHEHSHPPSRLGMSRVNSSDDAAADKSADNAPHAATLQVPMPVLPEATVAPESSADRAPTPNSRARFIQTLQGKSAWEALIHGSFS